MGGQGPPHARLDTATARARPPRGAARHAAGRLHARRHHRGRGDDAAARHGRGRHRRHRRGRLRDVPPERALASAGLRRDAGQPGRHRVREGPRPPGAGRRRRYGPLAGPRAARPICAGDQDARQPAARLPARPRAPRDRGRRVRRDVRADHARGYPRGDRGGDPRRARRRDAARDPPGRRPLPRGRTGVARRAVRGAGRPVRAPRRFHGGRAHLLGARPGAAPRGRADARRVPGRRGARRPAAGDSRLLPAEMTLSLVVLMLGLLVAGASAAVGVAAAAVSQLELTRWVAYKLRGGRAAARVLDNPGRVLATANALTTMGVIAAAAAVPALLAQATPTFLFVFTVTAGVPLFVSAAYLVPRVAGRRWAEPIVARAVPWLERVGRPLAPFIPSRDPSRRTTLAAVLSGADTGALASAGEMAVVSGVLAFAHRPVKELMTPRTAIVAIPEGLLAAEAAHVCAQSGYSRYPVYRGSLDDVVGVAHAFDLLALQPDAPVPVRPALVVPATTRAADLMLEMQRGRSHLAVVLDEFGGTAGVVTLEDLLRDLVEEIFGERAALPAAAAAASAGVLEVDANAPLGRIEAAFGVGLASPGVQSVGGLLIQALGRIPRPGERFLLRGFEFDILAATATRVERVAVRPGPVRAVPLDRAEERG